MAAIGICRKISVRKEDGSFFFVFVRLIRRFFCAPPPSRQLPNHVKKNVLHPDTDFRKNVALVLISNEMIPRFRSNECRKFRFKPHGDEGSIVFFFSFVFSLTFCPSFFLFLFFYKANRIVAQSTPPKVKKKLRMKK